MAKLELDLKHGNNVVGSTSIDLNGVPQFSLKYFSARPNKIPIHMNQSLISSEGGLDYIGPLQPQAGFLSGNTYTVEVTVLNAPVGTIVELDTRELQTVSGDRPDSVPGVIITPINGGATNQSRVAEFQVNFSTYPADPARFFWYGFKWVMSTSAGTFVDPTPQAVTFGGHTLTQGLKRRLNEDNLADRTIDIHPGTYGFWIDVFIGGGGGGMASYDGTSGNSGLDGGSVTLYMDYPGSILYRKPWTVDHRADSAIPIMFAEGGQGQPRDTMRGSGGVGVFFPNNLAPSDFRAASITLEKTYTRNGTSRVKGTAMSLFGGYIDRVINPPYGNASGEGWRTLEDLTSGSGAWALARIHCRRRASDGNLPIKPLNLRLFANALANGDYWVDIISTNHFNGGVEVKPPHSKVLKNGVLTPLVNARELPLLKTSSKGGLGGTGYSNGGRTARPGSIGIVDFGYYTAYA